jgi:hypothetical protein
MAIQQFASSAATALLFAAMFLWGDRLRVLRALVHDEGTVVSFGAGTSAAYVFVHVMPELHEVRNAFAVAVGVPLRFGGMIIYFVALVGFLVFYSLDHLRLRVPKNGTDSEPVGVAFALHIGGFAAYVGLMAYLLVRNLEETQMSLVLYAVAMALHFAGIDHALRDEHGAQYSLIGARALAASAIAGWGIGLMYPLPQYAIALMVAFISGAIIVNSMMMELTSAKAGRFLPFVVGGLLYALILLPLG